ncbi:MAG: cation:proton antiporter, partial [Gammaproteobacteria bacterium]|nr:cation:proton antiporter [Gammaproteobacteria bacterium]
LAGVLLGPSILGFVENRELVSILAELGVLLLLFLVGMELDLHDFKKVWKIALGCTLFQIAGSLCVVFLIGQFFNLSTGLSAVLGCAIALSSTAVAVKMMESIGEADTPTGRCTIGVLIAQDLAIVPMILILRTLNNPSFDMMIILKVVIAVGMLAGLILYFGGTKKIRIPFHQTLKKQEELLPLLCLGFCFGLATVAGLVGLSAPYGAFIAGLILGNTTVHHKLMESTKPIQSTFIMVFFLSVGLLMDLGFIWDNIAQVIVLLIVITVGKSLLNVGVLHALGLPWQHAFLSGLLLAQMGEFSFLLTTVGLESNLIDQDGSKLIISLAALSLTFSPLWLTGARRLHDMGPTKDIGSFKEIFDRIYKNEIDTVTKTCGSFTGIFLKMIKKPSNTSPKIETETDVSVEQDQKKDA